MADEPKPSQPNDQHETCCYTLRIVDGIAGTMGSAAAKSEFAKILKWLKKFPAKLGAGIIYVQITHVETKVSHTYVFAGVGLGAGLSVTGSTRGKGKTICCSLQDCPTFDNFTGWGRMTMTSVQAIVGGVFAFFDFGYRGDCRLYFENVFMHTKGLGAEIGTYIGYYIQID